MLIGENIILRPLKITDMEKTLEWRNNIELIKLTQGIRFPKTRAMEEGWFKNALNDTSNRNIYFGIDEIKTEKFIGIIQLSNIDWISKICEFGIVIGDIENRGKGYAKESMTLLFKYAFNILNLRKITLRVIGSNNNAIKLYRLINFIEEGYLKDHVFFDGKYYDVLVLSLFKENFILMGNN